MPLVSTYVYSYTARPIYLYTGVVHYRVVIQCVCVCVCVLGEGPDFTMTDEEVEAQAHRCNKKKKSAKTVEVYTYIALSHVLYHKTLYL